jgi:SET domain-containing protein
MFALNKRWVIDGSSRRNVARYINHSCRPNAKPVGRRGGIAIVALRRIEREEEITYDYGRDYLKSFLADGGCRCVACRLKKTLRRRRIHRRGKPSARS